MNSFQNESHSWSGIMWIAPTKIFFLRRTFLFFSYSFPNYCYHRFLLFLIVISGDAVSISPKNGAERDRVFSKAFSSAKPVVGPTWFWSFFVREISTKKSRREVGNRSFRFRRITPKAIVNRRAAVIKPVVLAIYARLHAVLLVLRRSNCSYYSSDVFVLRCRSWHS